MSLINDEWDVILDVAELEVHNCLQFQEFYAKVMNISEEVLKILDAGLDMNKLDSKGFSKYDCDLKSLLDKNKQLKHEISKKSDEITKQQTQYEIYKKDRKLLSQEVKETHEAFLMAKKYYKKFLKMYFTIESKTDDKQKILVQFFTESRRESDKYSVRLIRNVKTKSYELGDIKPNLKMFDELKGKHIENNDLPGLLSSIRQEFLHIKVNK